MTPSKKLSLFSSTLLPAGTNALNNLVATAPSVVQLPISVKLSPELDKVIWLMPNRTVNLNINFIKT